MNAEKFKAHAAYIASCRAAGGLILGFNTPCCNRSMETEAPREAGRTWDSLTTCPYCGELFMKTADKFKAEGRIPR